MRGYRAFRVAVDQERAEPILLPNFIGTEQARFMVPLEYPTVRAICPSREHRAPAPDCRCGYYAFSAEPGALAYTSKFEGTVMAAVLGHGWIEQHEHGWRAEQLKVMAFYWPVCSLISCNSEASIVTAQDVHSTAWPRALYFSCRWHEKVVIGSGRDQSRVAGADGEPFQLEFHWPATYSPWSLPAGEFMSRLAAVHEAGVYAFPATAKLLAEYGNWLEDLQSA